MTDGSAAPILRVEGAIKAFGGLLAVNRASLKVARGSITALIGPNGAGKSTLFNIVTGFVPSEAGRVVFDGHEITGLPSHRVAQLGLVRTFQLTKTFEAMTVMDNLCVAATSHPGERLINDFLRPRRVQAQEREVRERAERLMEIFTLADKRNEYAGELSGGQRKLLELARVLMLGPSMVLLDEPMAGVNPTLGRQILAHIHRLRDEQGTTFLFVEHDMEMVMNHADRIVVMADGAVIAEGLPREIRQDPRVLEAYMGVGATHEGNGR